MINIGDTVRVTDPNDALYQKQGIVFSINDVFEVDQDHVTTFGVTFFFGETSSVSEFIAKSARYTQQQLELISVNKDDCSW